ncbi:taperin [Entelurus aequoreus]|uniref:taperin n=1 Tax=Entelurus aequoreus TaxID=161455 RepID=UPI002B1DD59C|nr:taperin [Entelurus aequoreus]
MSGGGDVGFVRKDTGQESPRMPAWKREILERRKAKSGASAGAAEDAGGASPNRVNGEQTLNGGGPNRARNKDARPAAAEATSRSPDQESLVLHESLGPLEENPFIKLEKERRRRQVRENTARPIQHILELYGNVPGIRTIRADNIIIIESDPDYNPGSEDAKSPIWQQNCYCSMNDLLDRRCNAVTEIRAKEVVIYDTTLSKSEENLSTLGRTNHKDPSSHEAGEGQGMVSRILQKFDSNYGNLQKKSHSTENLLDLDGSVGRRPRNWTKPQLDLVPKHREEQPSPVGSRQASSPVSQSSWSPKSKPNFPGFEPSGRQSPTEASKSVTSFRQRLGDGESHVAAVASRDEPDTMDSGVSPDPKVPSSTQTSDISSKVLHDLPDFEIRASPKPDLSQIPDGDTQARALANLRLQSKNSFTVIPKRRLAASPETYRMAPATPTSPAEMSPSNQVLEQSTARVPSSYISAPAMMLQKLKEVKTEVVRPYKPQGLPPDATSPAPPPTSSYSNTLLRPSSPPSSSVLPSFSPHAVPPDPLPSSPTETPYPTDHLPVTNIDDIEVGSHLHHVPAQSPVAQRRKGNTFTVVPKRREADAQPSSPEPPQETSTDELPGSTPPQAPYSQLGTQLKKRYPAAEEIQVIGGYLSLSKSCLSKTGTLGKKLKISFKDSSLHSTYEYPSESSVWDNGENDDADKSEETVADEPLTMVGRIHIPQPSFTSPPTHTNSNDLANYIPKHSMDFSVWQKYKEEDSVNKEEVQQTSMTEEVMLTPADSSSLSDYSSEPALYF